MHPRFRETLSDLLPSERIHEWWRRLGNWQRTQQDIEKAVRSKTRALELVTERLTEDLREHLTNLSAPLLPQPTRRSPGVAPAGYLWHEFTQLNAACASLEAHASRAMPPDERVARFKSARLSQRLHGQARAAALARISRAAGRTIPDRPDIFIYDLSPESRDVNVRPGDISFALAPLNRQHLLDEHPNRVLVGSPIENRFVGYKRPAKSMEETGFTGVSVEALDRQHNLIALKAGLFCRIFDLEQHTDLDFSRDVMLDRVPLDRLSKKVDLTLQQIGTKNHRPIRCPIIGIGSAVLHLRSGCGRILGQMPHRHIPVGPHILTPIGRGRGRLRGSCVAIVNVEIGVLSVRKGCGLEM